MKRRDMTVYLNRIGHFDFNDNIGTEVPDFHVYEFIGNKEQEEGTSDFSYFGYLRTFDLRTVLVG